MKRHLVDAIVPQVRHEVMKMNRLTIAILIGMVLGIFVGHMVRTLASDPASVESFANNIGVVDQFIHQAAVPLRLSLA